MKGLEKNLRRDLIIVQGLCAVLTLLVLDSGVMFLFFIAATFISWGILLYLINRKNFGLTKIPSARFLIPIGSLVFAVLLSLLVQR